MRVVDSRRLTGPSLWLDRPGAILDVALDGAEATTAAAGWRAALTPLLEGVGWRSELPAERLGADFMSLAFTAPFDALYAATEVNEAAWAIATGASDETPAAACERLRAAIARERDPSLVALAQAAAAHGLAFLSDDKRVSVGLGAGSRTWPRRRIPASPDRVRWAGLHDVPLALVTGTNGKTTSVRLIAAMVLAGGRVVGLTSTDRVEIGGATVAEGDYAGPNGARTVLRDRRVEVAVLETARGGILRRGLPVRRANAALVTNVAADHLGEYGIHDLDTLADAKLLVARAVGPDGRVVLNADDPRLLARGPAVDAPVTWFTLDATHRDVRAHCAAGGDACVLDGDALVHVRGEGREIIARVADVPIAFGGAARYNIANALGAIGVAAALGVPSEAIAAGLRGFASTPRANPGRANRWRLGDVEVVVDYAHNPHGLAAIAEMVAAIPARRRGIVLGQAGDRDDAAIRALAHGAWAMRPARVFVKEMTSFLRGREAGAVPALLEEALVAAGAAPDTITRYGSELAAVRAAIDWARPGDLLLLAVHAERAAVIALLERMASEGWRPAPVAGEKT